jgi:SagB-type dehydrogenase family enzyme
MIKFDSLSYSLVDLFEADDHSAAEIFHESTKMTRRNYYTIVRRVEQIMRDRELLITMTRSYKSYAACDRVALPPPHLGTATLADTLLKRRSQIGEFAGGPITAEQLSAILRFSFGPTAERPIPPDGKLVFRSAPSGGGLYPVEIYPLVFDVTGLEPGIYHYSVLDNSLEVLRRGDVRQEVVSRELTPYVGLASTCAVLFAVTAVMPRTLSKYLFRGYRFLSYDVGAVVQNFYLTGTALGLGTCAVGGFFDNEMGDFLDVDNVDESVMMMFSVGQAGPPVMVKK